MAKAGRLWFPLDASFWDDQMVLDAGERAAVLYQQMLCRIRQTGQQGVISRRQVQALHRTGWQVQLQALLKVGLVIELDPDTLGIPAWDGWRYDQAKESRAAYMREWRQRQRDTTP